MTKRIVFFNYFHNGDIHVSRGFVKQIVSKVKQMEPDTQFAYAHKGSPDLLADIPHLGFDGNGLSIINNEHSNLHNANDTIYINTWYGQQNFKYMNRHGVSMDTLYAAMNDSCKDIWGFSLNDISEDPAVFYPTIDYDHYHVQYARNWINQHPEKKIFVSNGMTLSGQAHNFAMGPLIDIIARKHGDKTFILSNLENGITANNIHFSERIIQKGNSDLNENAFLSEYCDTIIGRASGSFTFALTHNNLFQRDCKMLCLSNLVPQKEGKFWLADLLSDKMNYRSPVTTSNESDPNAVLSLMESYI